jgi:hypothetical protein
MRKRTRRRFCCSFVGPDNVSSISTRLAMRLLKFLPIKRYLMSACALLLPCSLIFRSCFATFGRNCCTVTKNSSSQCWEIASRLYSSIKCFPMLHELCRGSGKSLSHRSSRGSPVWGEVICSSHFAWVVSSLFPLAASSARIFCLSSSFFSPSLILHSCVKSSQYFVCHPGVDELHLVLRVHVEVRRDGVLPRLHLVSEPHCHLHVILGVKLLRHFHSFHENGFRRENFELLIQPRQDLLLHNLRLLSSVHAQVRSVPARRIQATTNVPRNESLYDHSSFVFLWSSIDCEAPDPVILTLSEPVYRLE